MIKIDKVEVSGWESAIRGMRNPLNSWDKSDSLNCDNYPDCNSCRYVHTDKCNGNPFIVGDNDLDLMMRLSKAGSDHAKYRRFIVVTFDLLSPLYFLKEWDTYKVGTVANSTSTMHKIHAKEFSKDDFSHEQLDSWGLNSLEHTVNQLNRSRELYLETKDKKYWYSMIQLLPSSYNQLRTIQLNYEVLANMYKSRKNHKLDEWVEFCKWIESLPYSEIITGANKDEG